VPTPSERCDHIGFAIDAILRDVNGHGEQAFLAAHSLRAACYFHFIIIGEAGESLLRSSANVIVQHAPSLVQSLSFAHRLRTLLVHQYHRIDPKIVWDTIQKDLPQLLTDITILRAALP
jgi:uncharacterized protein with HEPN domain